MSTSRASKHTLTRHAPLIVELGQLVSPGRQAATPQEAVLTSLLHAFEPQPIPTAKRKQLGS
jgi:hypothetical protein